jgi:ribosomal 30S subunit maturation factor RimM
MDQTTQRSQPGDRMGREIVGASVISETQAPVGRVVDVVFSASNQPEFVVIESAGKTVAVPYSVANANMSANKIVIDESRLQSAPKMKQGEWRSKTEGTWKKDATRYWERDQG